MAAIQSRTVLFTIATGWQPHYELALPRLARLAREYGWIFRCFTSGFGVPCYADTWLRFRISDYVPDTDRYVYLDADVLVNPFRAEPADLERLASGNELQIALDQPWRITADPQFYEWCSSNFNRTPPGGSPYYNSGVLSFTREIADLFLYSLPNPALMASGFPNDQHWLNWIIHAHGIPVSVLPREMNWMEPDLDTVLREAKLVHFAAGRKHLIPEFVRRVEISSVLSSEACIHAANDPRHLTGREAAARCKQAPHPWV